MCWLYAESNEKMHSWSEIYGAQSGEGQNGGNEMAQQMKAALLSALEKDEQFAFLRDKYGDIRNWFEKVWSCWEKGRCIRPF